MQAILLKRHDLAFLDLSKSKITKEILFIRFNGLYMQQITGEKNLNILRPHCSILFNAVATNTPYLL